jgi:hypothetical protein
MTPSEQCKQAGLKSLAEAVKISSVSERTLINWQKNKPQLFNVVLIGCAQIKNTTSCEKTIDTHKI